MNKYTKIKDFHGERAKGIGSSDIPILAGLTRRYDSTPLTLWQQKTGRSQPWEGNQRTEWGNKLEGMVLREFIANRYDQETANQFFKAKLSNKSIGAFKSNTEARHAERKYCLAHADLVVDWLPEQPYIVEAKTAGMMSGKRREGQIFTGYDPEDLSSQGIPDAVFLQVQWQMYCYDVKTAYVAVLIDTADYREYGPIQADPRVQEKCLALAERFWGLIQSDTPPAPETWSDVQLLFPSQKNTTAMIGGEAEQNVRAMIDEDKSLAQREKSLKERRDEIKNAIGILLGENSVLSSAEGETLAKSGEQTRESVSLAGIKKKAPEIEAKLRELELIKSTTFRTVKF